MEINCTQCNKKCVKNGFQSNGQQRYKCVFCGRRQQFKYLYSACKPTINSEIIILTKEGLGIRGISRVLNISTTTLLKRLISIAADIKMPLVSKAKIYEVDEMRTFIRSKDNLIWIVYALERSTKKVTCFSVGKRTNKTINSVIKTLELSEAQKFYTDGLRNYRFLISDGMHIVQRFGTNMIERKNLSLRIHLKRLNRRTICFSRSLLILNAILKIYFWAWKMSALIQSFFRV